MKNVATNSRYWLAGVAVAFGGVVLARWVAPACRPASFRLACTVGGQLLAFAGLLIICIGVSRRIRRSHGGGKDCVARLAPASPPPSSKS